MTGLTVHPVHRILPRPVHPVHRVLPHPVHLHRATTVRHHPVRMVLRRVQRSMRLIMVVLVHRRVPLTLDSTPYISV
ncbi:hypothetical protein QJS10_CPB17g02149 [Acorus calamus]|uniref:Uncharacterized protein n=1 Tax=Acorus calamus TaxID=4465 RepID=A0AAV9CVB9_ACOCL|nr:hypothetical protein QJS10_CPB17g02149 [Acorus calamus]